MNCELCGGYIDAPANYKLTMHWSCLDRVLDSLNQCPQSLSASAARCPDINPSQRGSGRIIRKSIKND